MAELIGRSGVAPAFEFGPLRAAALGGTPRVSTLQVETPRARRPRAEPDEVVVEVLRHEAIPRVDARLAEERVRPIGHASGSELGEASDSGDQAVLFLARLRGLGRDEPRVGRRGSVRGSRIRRREVLAGLLT